MMVLVIVFSMVISCFDAIVNLLTPKFSFTNDAEVIKQSVGAFLAIFGGLALMVISGVTFYYFSDLMSVTQVFLMMVLVNLILLIPMALFLDKKTESIFNKLHA